MSRNTLFIGAISSQSGDGGGGSPSDRNITGVNNPGPQTVLYDTDFSGVLLPLLVTVTLDDESTADISVVWAPGSYDQTTAGVYNIVGTLQPPTGITNLTNITASASVTVLADQEFDIYGTVGGNDTTGDGSIGNPYLTLAKCIVEASALGGQRTIKLGPGDFVQTSFISVPTNISIRGDGVDATFIKGDSSLNYTANLGAFEFGTDKFLLTLSSGSPTSGNQSISNLTIDGDARAKHGAIYIVNRNTVTLRDVKITNFNFSGVWFISTDTLQIIDSVFIDNSAESTGYCTGAIMMGHNTNTLIQNVSVNEGAGYGIKAFGPAPTQPIITNLRINGSSVSVEPTSDFGGGGISNISLELHDSFVVNAIIDNSYFDNTASFVTAITQTSNYSSSAKVLTFRDNFCDLQTRAASFGYPIELTAHNVDVFNNYIWGGSNAAIVNWESNGQARDNWLIYNNIFYDQQAVFPSPIIRSYSPLTNFRFYNNTVQIVGNNTVNILQTEGGQNSSNWTVRNNLILDESTADTGAGGPNSFIRLEGGGSIANLLVTHNCIFGMPIGAIPGGVYNNNLTVDPILTKTGLRPDPYYRPLPGSPLIGAGINVGVPFTGATPTIGRYEASASATAFIESVDSQNDLLISTGTVFSNLTLPTNVTVTLSDTTRPSLAVTWAPGSYDENTEAIYTVVGTISLPANVTNPNSLTATLSIIVSDAVYLLQDSFDRASLGPTYTTENVTAILDNVNMVVDGTDGTTINRVYSEEDITGINDLEVKILHEVLEVNSTSYGLGLGIQNIVNPDPNKGVHLRINLSSSATSSGILQLYSGNSNTNNADFGLRASSATRLVINVGDIFETTFRRVLSGSDAIFTAVSRNTTTEETVTTTWTEVGAGSLVYESTSRITIFHNGGAQQVNNLTIEDIGIVSPFPNVVSVQTTAPISVANGTAFGTNGAGVGLPATRTVTLSDATTPSYSITWAQGSYLATTAGNYNITGTIQLPVDVTNTNNVVASCVVTVLAPSTGSVTADYWVGGPGASDSNNGLTEGAPFATIQAAANVAQPGDDVVIRGGVYRQTIVPTNSGTTTDRITYFAYPGESVLVSGLNEAGDSGWTVHSGQIYKKTITLPITGWASTISSTTSIVANQIFKDGNMMFEARYPKVSSPEQLFDRNVCLRNLSQITSFTSTALTDSGINTSVFGSLVGAKLRIDGWYLSITRTITSHSGSTVGYAAYSDNATSGAKRRRYYFVSGKLGLLTQEREWHYEGGILYFWQPGGGSPTSVEYKARNWGFDLRGKSNITIAGIKFTGCEPVVCSTTSNNTVVDNIRCTYQNHLLQNEGDNIYGNPLQTGIKLIGPNSTIKNSEFKYAACQGTWLGTNCIYENNLAEYINYNADYGCPVDFNGNDAGQKVLRNTFRYTGRSGINFYGTGEGSGTTHFNIEIGYNDISKFGALNVDLGGIYASRGVRTTGMRIHHNWIHDSLATNDAENLQLGINTGMYFDQASGPCLYDHNVEWNNVQTGMYTQQYYNGVNAGKSTLVHNVFATQGSPLGGGNRHSYKSSDSSGTANRDIQRNNIYRDDVIQALGSIAVDVANSVTSGTNPLFAGTDLATEQGLYFRIQSGSPARNIGTTVSGVDHGFIDGANPDAGTYEFNDPAPWVPGYNAVPFDDGGGDPGGDPDPTPELIQAESFDAQSGGVTIEGGDSLGSCDTNEWVQYDVNFVEEKDKIRIRYGRQWTSPIEGQLEVRVGTFDGTLLATVNLPNTGAWANYTTVEALLSAPIQGIESIFIVFKAAGSGKFDWFEFVLDELPPGTGDLETLDSVSPIFVPYNTAFGTNGAGVGLPQTIGCTFSGGGGSGTVSLTWAIGSYSPTAAAFDDILYSLVGTPVTGGGITNTLNLTATCDVTVRDIFHPLTTTIAGIWSAIGLVNNTNNTFGEVSSNNMVRLKSLAPGPLGRDFIVRPATTAPTFTTTGGARIVFVGTGLLEQENSNTNFEYLHYKATSSDLKHTSILAVNLTDLDTYVGIMGNNGSFSGNRGITYAYNGTSVGQQQFQVYVTNGTSGSPAINWTHTTMVTPATDIILTGQVDNALAAASGKVKGFKGTTQYDATAAGNGVLNNTLPPPAKLQLGDMGTNGNNDMTGSIRMVVMLEGVESDAVRNKLVQDIATYCGITL